jgi:WD40 repeat protein
LNVPLSADGKRALAASPGNMMVLDLKDNKPRVLENNTALVSEMAFSADGKLAVSGSSVLRVWDLQSGEDLSVFTCDAPAISCAWRGDRVIAGDMDGQV